MSKSQRTKGAVFERDVCKIFSDALGREFKRNIGQARDGGNDIDVGPLVVECKRRKTLGTVYSWLKQAWDASVTKFNASEHEYYLEPRVPIIVARQDADTSPIVILRLKDFLVLAKPELLKHLEGADHANV